MLRSDAHTKSPQYAEVRSQYEYKYIHIYLDIHQDYINSRLTFNIMTTFSIMVTFSTRAIIRASY